MDWKKLYDFVDAHVIRSAERHRADVQRIDSEIARERRRIDIAQRLRSREVVMEAIVRDGVFWR